MGLLGGIQLVGLGVVGEYISRIYREVRGRPMYVTRERVGFHRTGHLCAVNGPAVLPAARGCHPLVIWLAYLD